MKKKENCKIVWKYQRLENYYLKLEVETKSWIFWRSLLVEKKEFENFQVWEIWELCSEYIFTRKDDNF